MIMEKTTGCVVDETGGKDGRIQPLTPFVVRDRKVDNVLCRPGAWRLYLGRC
jgi:hypothetical protein